MCGLLQNESPAPVLLLVQLSRTPYDQHAVEEHPQNQIKSQREIAGKVVYGYRRRLLVGLQALSCMHTRGTTIDISIDNSLYLAVVHNATRGGGSTHSTGVTWQQS